MNSKLIKKLQQRQEEGTMRSLLSYVNHVDFYSNDYLGMAQTPGQYEMQGATGSRLISGNSAAMEKLETDFAQLFGAEASLFYQSGYAANIGFFSCVPQKGDVVLYDEECHASIRDGLRLSTANSYKFAHNDLVDLERLLEKYKEADQLYFVVEGLYSMTGKIVPVLEVMRLAKDYGAELIVDEAHSAGVYGEDGKGLFAGTQVTRLITFGKAYGTHGAVWLVEEEMRNYLINFSRSFIYTTAPPLGMVQHAWESVQRVAQRNDRMRLQENIALFRGMVHQATWISDATSPIQMLQFANREQMRKVEKRLLEKDFAVKAIYAPTVHIEKEGLRISIHSFNTAAEIKEISEILNL